MEFMQLLEINNALKVQYHKRNKPDKTGEPIFPSFA